MVPAITLPLSVTCAAAPIHSPVWGRSWLWPSEAAAAEKAAKELLEAELHGLPSPCASTGSGRSSSSPGDGTPWKRRRTSATEVDAPPHVMRHESTVRRPASAKTTALG
eukprot:scaffold23306_cov125-Isochrysis_galbana.AAC.10